MTKNTLQNKIIFALDVSDEKEVNRLLDIFSGHIKTVKIGKQLFTRLGPEIVKKTQKKKYDVFLDLKFHDIPNTVKNAVFEAARLGVKMLTVHTSGGSDMMKAAIEGACEAVGKENKDRLKILGVTVLTSLTTDILNNEIGIMGDTREVVRRLALLASGSGLDGVIASPHEITAVKEACGKDFLVVTPGIRPSWTQRQDQKRVMTPKEAIELGADYLVIGRAILSEKDPIEAFYRIIES